MLQESVDDYIAALTSREHQRAGTNLNTVMAYRNDLRQLCHYLQEQGVEQWAKVTRNDLTDYLDDMREGQSYRPTTIARKLAAFKSFFRYMKKEERIEENPAEALEAPPIPKEPPHVLTLEQISSLFEQVDVRTVVGQRDLAMLHMLSATGMRSSELVALQLDDFDKEHATIESPGRNTQTRRDRTLPLLPIVVETTTQYITKARPRLARQSNEKALFLNHHGERLTRQGFWLIIKGYARQAGIDEITPHMLRHSFAMLTIEGGIEPRSLQEILGNIHFSTTQVYTQMAHAKNCK